MGCAIRCKSTLWGLMNRLKVSVTQLPLAHPWWAIPDLELILGKVHQPYRFSLSGDIQQGGCIFLNYLGLDEITRPLFPRAELWRGYLFVSLDWLAHLRHAGRPELIGHGPLAPRALPPFRPQTHLLPPLLLSLCFFFHSCPCRSHVLGVFLVAFLLLPKLLHVQLQLQLLYQKLFEVRPMLWYEIFDEHLRLFEGGIEILLLQDPTFSQSQWIRRVISRVCERDLNLRFFQDLRCRGIERDVSTGWRLDLTLARSEKRGSPNGDFLTWAWTHGISSVGLDLQQGVLRINQEVLLRWLSLR